MRSESEGRGVRFMTATLRLIVARTGQQRTVFLAPAEVGAFSGLLWRDSDVANNRIGGRSRWQRKVAGRPFETLVKDIQQRADEGVLREGEKHG